MSAKSHSAASPPPKRAETSDCAAEAVKLLNCVANKAYNKEKCVELLDSLRACVKKKGVVDFTLLTEDTPSPESTEQK